MKFIYQYRTADNIQHEDVICARDRDAAFTALKQRGVRPSRLYDAPGIVNKVFGKGKRWIAILALSVALAAICLRYFYVKAQNRYAAEDRAQIFADPAVFQKLSRDGWGSTFHDKGNAWMARHAIPGKICDCSSKSAAEISAIASSIESGKESPIAIVDSDDESLQKMKRMVNGVKRELTQYLGDGGKVEDFMSRSCERVRIEAGIYSNYSDELGRVFAGFKAGRMSREQALSVWEKRNATLRSIGLPTIFIPSELGP